MLKNGIVLVRFDAKGDNDVIQVRVYHFDSKPIIAKAWIS